MVEICLVGNTLLTRVEHNAKSADACRTVVLYNHGFPDSSVTPNAMQEFSSAKDANGSFPDHGFWASRFPRKVCDHLMSKCESVAFVAFNTRGVPGSLPGPPSCRVEEAPAEFKSKTLVGDIEDITQVSAFLTSKFPLTKGRFFIFGLSTGAFLALAFAARPDLHPPGGVAGCVTVACVDDIPSSVTLDFSPEQIQTARETGVCIAPFFPFGGQDNPQQWELSSSYLDSYSAFPAMQQLAQSLCVPVLLIHGQDDRHVPVEHAHKLEIVLREHASCDVTTAVIPKANHFFSSNSGLNKALAALTAFIQARSASAE